MSLKEEMLKLLEEDEEFRYAVAGKLGLLEILERLTELREDFNKHAVESGRRFEALEARMVELRESHDRLREDFNRHAAESNKRFEALETRIAELREDFNKMVAIIGSIEARLGRVERTLEKLTLDIEEEAREVVRHRVREVYGVDIELERLHLPDVEVNIYGVSGDVCVLGEATVRAGVGALRRLKDKLRVLQSRYPERLRPKLVLLVYTSLATPDLVREAESEGVWVLKAAGDVVPPRP